MSERNGVPLSANGDAEPARQLLALWEQGQRPSVWEFLASVKSLSREQFLEVLLVDQRERWRSGERVLVETYLEQQPTLRSDEEAVLDLAYRELLLRRRMSENPSEEEYFERFPQYEARLRKLMEVDRFIDDFNTQPAEIWPQVSGYEIRGLLGEGGMGVVYKAWHMNLKRLVALKMMNGLPGSTQRFRREAELLARLQHPNFVQIYDIGEHEGRPYLSLEYVEGGNLEKELAGGPQPPAEAAALIEKLARAMHAAHQLSIVHRDLKPANVLLTSAGVPKITDFGLAKCQEDVGLTQSGMRPGTPPYMAPEQAAGDSEQIGPATDVYALGVVLYEMLTGRPPFCGPDPAKILNLVQMQDPVAPGKLQKGVPRDLERICLKCLEKHPAKRYRTAEELADELRRFQEGKPLRHTRRTPVWEKMWKWVRRRPALAAILVLGPFLALLSGVVGLLYWDHHREKVVYYPRFVNRRLNMEGVGPPLSAEQVRHRSLTYKFSMRGGLVQKVEVVNGQGELTTRHTATPFIDNAFAPAIDKRHCIYKFERDDQGQITEETACDRDEQVVYRMRYDPKTRLGQYVNGEGFPYPLPGTKASYVKFSWMKTGLLESILYTDEKGNYKQGMDGSYGLEFGYNGQNMLEKVKVLDDKGQPMLGELGFAQVRIDYSDGGRCEENTYLGVDGAIVTRKDGFAKLRLHFDAKGNLNEAVFLDAEGKPCRCTEGYAQIKFAHDDRGNLLERFYLDPNGKPDSATDGTSIEVYDSAGNVKERTLICKAGDPGWKGVARTVVKYDRHGRQIQEDYFDESNQRVAVDKTEYVRINVDYDEASAGARISFHGVKNDKNELLQEVDVSAADLKTPKPTPKGVYRITYDYDQAPDTVRISHLGIENEPLQEVYVSAVDLKTPKPTGEGVYRITYDYDRARDTVRISHHGIKNGKNRLLQEVRVAAADRETPKPTRDGVYRINYGYDEIRDAVKVFFHGSKGELLQVVNLAPDLQTPKPTPRGVYRITYDYDEARDVVRVSYYGIKDLLYVVNTATDLQTPKRGTPRK
jgi:serine/threonine-protein kinase